MIKHVGRHNERKIIIVYREVPEQAHMALVVYSDVLPGAIHDPVMKVLENEGQSEKLVADAFHKAILPDGRNMLGALHSEGYLKKVQTNQIVVTANATSNVRLDELNKIINEMETGDEAKQRLEKLDSNRGLVDPTVGRELGAPPERNVPPVTANTNTALSDSDIANNLLKQANEMEVNAKSMLEESKRLKAEAKELTPKKTAPKATGVKKTTAKKTVA